MSEPSLFTIVERWADALGVDDKTYCEASKNGGFHSQVDAMFAVQAVKDGLDPDGNSTPDTSVQPDAVVHVAK